MRTTEHDRGTSTLARAHASAPPPPLPPPPPPPPPLTPSLLLAVLSSHEIDADRDGDVEWNEFVLEAPRLLKDIYR